MHIFFLVLSSDFLAKFSDLFQENFRYIPELWCSQLRCVFQREREKKEGKVIFNATHCARSLFLTKLSEADISASEIRKTRARKVRSFKPCHSQQEVMRQKKEISSMQGFSPPVPLTTYTAPYRQSVCATAPVPNQENHSH